MVVNSEFRSPIVVLALEQSVSLSFAVAKLGFFFEFTKYFCSFF